VRRRLYVQIYTAFLGVGLLTLVVTALVANWLFDRPLERLDADLVVWDAEGKVVGRSGTVDLPYGPEGRFRDRGSSGLRIQLPDGRMLGAGSPKADRRRIGFLAVLVVTGLTVAVGCWPIARRITRRLELVQDGMQRWGEGDLARRVPVLGEDEVAAVARTFNGAADRVEVLFDAQRRVLASASHELRSPLARLRMSLALLDDEGGGHDRAALVRGAERDIEELDATVGDLLQVGRMQAVDGPDDPQPVELHVLLAEEGARVGATVTGPPRTVSGDAVLLRRLVRNLMENAARHGAPPIEAHTTDGGFDVLDRGPGVPLEHREDVFRPFWRAPGATSQRDGGVGLGLHLVRAIARHHRGEVRVESREGGGSRFVVELPT
jgi:signal transduction histidine kinase